MTHCERVLDLLADGEPHSHHELYALNIIAHSRISDLRRKGYAISQWRQGDEYLYQLASLGEPSPAEGATDPLLQDGPLRPGSPPLGSPSEDFMSMPEPEAQSSLASSEGPSQPNDWGRTDGGSSEQLTLEVAA